MSTITIDPVTRIEGHLKAEVTVESGVVTDAKVSGTMARGIEDLLLGKDPRDATYVTERICGVCFGAHGWTSCLAVENAHGAVLPEAARLLRNLLVGACWLHDHPLHFYHLAALDYLDVWKLTEFTGTDPTDPIYKLKQLILNDSMNGDQAGPLLPRYTPDVYCVNDAAIVELAVRHYLLALEEQVRAKRMSALLAGKQPHQSGMVVGGVTQLPSPATLNEFESILGTVDLVNPANCTGLAHFIVNTYVKDVWFFGVGGDPFDPEKAGWGDGPLYDLATLGVGMGHQNYLSYGGFPDGNGDFLYPAGAYIGEGDPAPGLVANDRATIEIALYEDVTQAFYPDSTAGHPADTSQIFQLGKDGAHSFVKAPRYRYGDPEVKYPMEVGPLARMMVAVNRTEHPAHSHPATGLLIDLVTNYSVQPGAVARHAARALETLILLGEMPVWLQELRALIDNPPPEGIEIHDTDKWDPPESGTGWGMTEAPRGGLAHWVGIADHVISHYACVVPTTWNSSPTDGDGNLGPYEKALIGCPVPDTDNPINVVRIIRSFDPCIACAVHVVTPKGETKKFVLDV